MVTSTLEDRDDRMYYRCSINYVLLLSFSLVIWQETHFLITQWCIFNVFTEQGECATNQRNDQGKEPSINEEVVSADLYDVQQQGGHRKQDALSDSKLLHGIFEEKPQRLRGGADIKREQSKQEINTVC